jgi:hypothetical protein
MLLEPLEDRRMLSMDPVWLDVEDVVLSRR